MQVSVIVPTYNEKENIVSLVTQLLALPMIMHIIVVDDNSPDGTGEIADWLAVENAGRVSVIHHPGKLGLGTAYIAGFKEALAEGADLVCSMDADFSHNPRCVADIVDKINQGYDLVIGSRYVRGGRSTQTLDRKVVSWSANTITRVLLGLHAHDTTAGFRCYRRQALEGLDLDSIKSSGYSFLFEMLFRVERLGWKVGEVPIIFQDRRMGASKISRNEIVKALRMVLWLAPRRLANPT
ncbi:MAG: polyprenol monophosphomannose synthase [Halobacteriota archaeon]|jgi:glycosyltransferase involved in cell wall biosynthesis